MNNERALKTDINDINSFDEIDFEHFDFSHFSNESLIELVKHLGENSQKQSKNFWLLNQCCDYWKDKVNEYVKLKLPFGFFIGRK